MDKVFTIYICTYNGENTIRQSIDSILNLECLNDLVYKVVVVDNNSTDNTKNIVIDYCKKYRIVEYEFEKVQGLSYAREHALKALTDWIVYIDDDNILDKNWILELYNTINDNNSVGVVNGAVVAYTQDELTESEKNCLNVIYRDLACTNVYGTKIPERNFNPIGAGMCIRTSCIKNIENNGWLKLIGRKGEILSSGEDGELCSKVIEQGYNYIYNKNMIIYHIIPRKRLSDVYVEKLIRGLVVGRINYLLTLKFGKIRYSIRKIKYLFIKFYLRLRVNNFEIGSYDYWNYRIKMLIADSFLENV